MKPRRRELRALRQSCHGNGWCCQRVDGPLCNSPHDPHLLARLRFRILSRVRHDDRPENGLRVYPAARFDRAAEMRQVRDDLIRQGVEVTSRWIDLHGGDVPTDYKQYVTTKPELLARFAAADMEDVAAAHVLVSFTEGGGGAGGRHVEFGMAAILGKQLVIVGPREHVFHCLSSVRVCSLDELGTVLASIEHDLI